MSRQRQARLGKTAVALLVVGAFWCGWGGAVEAAFQSMATGSSFAKATAVPQAATPAASVNAQDVTVSWSATQVSAGVAASRYTVRRFSTDGTLLATLTDCATGAALDCVDSGVANGMYKYSVNAGYQLWNGAQSAFSTTVTVGSTFTITSNTTVSTLPSTVTGNVTGLTLGAALTFRLDSATGTVLSGTPAIVLTPTSQDVSITLPLGTTDGAHSIFVLENGTARASASLTVALPPQLQTLVMSDLDGNGKVDRVVATFDESLAAYTAGTTPWTLTNVPSGGTLAGVTVSGAQATLTITEGTGAADTAVGSFTIALASNANGIRDAAGNRSTFAATAPSDAAKPVAMTITDTNGLLDGKFESADTISITFSEGLLPSTIPASSTVTLTDASASATDLLTISGVSAADRALGGNDYIATNKVATFTASAVTLSISNRTITVVLGLCGGACSSLGQQATPGTYSYLPAASITDPAGNTSTAVRTVSIRLF